MVQKLKIAAKPTFSAPVVMRVVGDNAGIIEVKFTAVFKRLDQPGREALRDALVSQSITDSGVLDLVLADWEELVDVDGLPFLCSPENRAAANADWPEFEWFIALAYFETVNKAQQKN